MGVAVRRVGTIWCTGQNFIGRDREQAYLMPPSLRDWMAEDHPVWTVLESVGEMDLSGLCREAGLVKVGVIAVDGTKVHASASKHANRDYRQLAREILAEADRTDREEDERYGRLGVAGSRGECQFSVVHPSRTCHHKSRPGRST
jgi:hypothetical protein